MRLQRRADGSVFISDLDSWHLGVLRKIPALADPGNSGKALKRVFPDPYANKNDASEAEREDWDQFVRPDLEALFSQSLDRVSQDVAAARPEADSSTEKAPAKVKPARRKRINDSPGIQHPEPAKIRPPQPPARPVIKAPLKKLPQPPTWTLTVPAAHVEDWFRAMNQARLVLSATHDAHRTDNDHIARMFLTGKMETVVHYELLTSLCGWWVDALMSGQ